MNLLPMVITGLVLGALVVVVVLAVRSGRGRSSDHDVVVRTNLTRRTDRPPSPLRWVLVVAILIWVAIAALYLLAIGWVRP